MSSFSYSCLIFPWSQCLASMMLLVFWWSQTGGVWESCHTLFSLSGHTQTFVCENEENLSQDIHKAGRGEGRRAVTGPWTENIVRWHGIMWGPVSKQRRDIPPSPGPILGWGPFVPLLPLSSQHEPSHYISLEETSGRLHSSPPPECIFPCAYRLLLLLSFFNAVFPSLLWFWTVFGRSGHYLYTEGESSPAQLLSREAPDTTSL